MKNLMLVLFLTGCTVGTKEANKWSPSVHAENQFKWYYNKYYPACVNHCRIYECSKRCEKDFQEIKKVLIRAINDNKENDFAETMETWYSHD